MDSLGYIGLFLASLLAGSIIPFSSEVALGAVVAGTSMNTVGCLITATVGNTLGGMTCYYLGRLGRIDWVERYLHLKHARVERACGWVRGRGALMAFFSFLPFVGGAIAVALGLLRGSHTLTLVSMFAGKLIRYIVLLLMIYGATQVVG